MTQILNGDLSRDTGPITTAVNHFSQQLVGPAYVVYADYTRDARSNAAAMYLGPGGPRQQADIHYDPNFFRWVVQNYGWDAVWGILAHEIGHAHLGMFSRYVRDYTDENSADARW